MTVSITNAAGERVDLTAALQPQIFLQMQEAAADRVTAQAFVNGLAATRAAQPTVFEQIADAYGFHVGRDNRYGVRPTTMGKILGTTGNQAMQAGAITRDVDLGPRVFFPIYALSVMEKALRADNNAILGAYNRMVGVRDTIPGDTYERPIIDYTEAEKPRAAAIAQLGEPRVMVKATVSNKIYRVPHDSIGIEYSDQAAKALGLDFLMNGFARRAEAAAVDRVFDKVYSFLNGDVDMDMGALAAASVVNDMGVTQSPIQKASSFDASIVASGALTQTAWVKWLSNRSKRVTINFVITDMNGALAIQNRTGRPTVQGDNATSKRIDTGENVVNPLWPGNVDIFIINDSRWPANMILGLDTRYGVHHVDSTALNYQGAEQWAIRRSTKLRFDSGDVASRLYDDAWAGLNLTP